MNKLPDWFRKTHIILFWILLWQGLSLAVRNQIFLVGPVIFIFRDFSVAFARHKLIGFYINGQELLFLGRFFKKRIYIFGILFKSCTIL